MGYAFNGTNPNLNYAVNQLNKKSNLVDTLLNTAAKGISNIINGAGASASNAEVETAVQWAVNKASNNYITYSQTNRNLKNPNGTSYDCSSFIITAFYAAGFDIAATTTRDMKDGFVSAGWVWIPGNSFESSELLRGDILLNEELHTQMYIGNNRDVNCGNTPAQVQAHSVDNYGRGWNGILRRK